MLKKIGNLFKALTIVGSIMFLSFITPQVHNQYLRYEVGTSVVQVLSPAGGGGSGFAVEAASGNNYIMTNKHVCDAAVGGWVIIAQDKLRLFKRVVYKDNKHDLCLVEGDRRFDALNIGNGLYKGESMYIVGHPGLRALTVAQGEFIGFDTVELLDERVINKKQCNGEIYELSPMEQWASVS